MTETCRFCATKLTTTVADLGLTPVSNELRNIRDAAGRGQTFYPLKAMVCEACWLVQLTRVEMPAHFTEDYVYFSSFSESWLRHARDYAHTMIAAQALNGDSLVVELASNDGYLLQYFKQAGIPVLGIDPTEDNNVLAYVHDPKDFIGGIPAILKPGGTFTIEFPHILRMLESCQFDTIYHEHFSYLSLLTVERMLGAYGLEVYGVEELPTHGGSLRVYASHEGAGLGSVELAVGLDRVRLAEKRAGLDSAATYRGFANEVEQRKIELLDFLIKTKRAGKKVLGYGAPAKGSTMLNYCGVGPELLPFTVDRSPHKQGHYLPGVNIPILAPEELIEARPDYVLILPWNLRDEIAAQLCQLRDWGGRFVVAIPRIEIF